MFEGQPNTPSPAPRSRGAGISGRIVIAVGVLVIGAAIGSIALLFRGFRAEYTRTAEWGLREVVPLVEGFHPLAPPDIPAEEWGEAVAATEELMRRVVTCGLLDRSGLEALRADLAGRAGRTRPETARGELALLWADMLTATGPRLSAGPGAEGSERFPVLPAPGLIANAIRYAMTVDRLLPLVPVGTTREEWEQTVAETRRLLAISNPRPDERAVGQLARRVGEATPKTVRQLLASLWDEFGEGVPGLARPGSLGRD